MTKQIYRSSHNAVIGGVCGGLGEYFNIDPVIMRILWLLLLFSGVGFLAYIVAWIIIPRKPLDDYEVIENDDYDENGGV
jgi:phage shock protein PspC (stress-responsive transcriptional regulator)